MKQSKNVQEIIPDGLIIFISGVPGMGKTTISYEMLKRFNKFRIVEETDLIREILRGYNEHLKIAFGNQIDFIFEKICITDHTKLLTLEEAKFQCNIMKQSYKQIIARQQRKGIATIINGVHVIPEVLYDISYEKNIIYINLYVTNEREIYDRIYKRDCTSYMLEHIPFIFKTNNELYLSTEKITTKSRTVFNIDVTGLSIDDTIDQIIKCIKLLD